MRRLSFLLALAGLAVMPATAWGAPYLPPAGKVFDGGTGGYTGAQIQDFAERSGRRPAVYQYFFTPRWTRPDQRSLHWQEGLLRQSAAAGVHPMFALSTARGGRGRGVVTPGGLARGEGDGYVIDLA